MESGNYAQTEITPNRKLRPNVNYAQGNYDNVISYAHIPLNAGEKRSGATCHMVMPQCCYLAKGAKRLSHTTNMLTSSNNNLKIIAAIRFE